MVNRRQIFGSESETLAVQYLKKQGYRILETNYRNALGEIDIIAKDKGSLVFVEVKARRSFRFGDPKFAITPQKKRKISMVALGYLKSTQQERAKARFDVVAISREMGEQPVIDIIRNAFDLAYE